MPSVFGIYFTVIVDRRCRTVGRAMAVAYRCDNHSVTEEDLYKIRFSYLPRRDILTQKPFVSSSHSPVQPAEITYTLESASANTGFVFLR